MVGNLSAMGLQIQIADAIVPLRNVRFVLTTLIASFGLSPALAYLVVLLVPMEQPYAIGVLLLGMAPAAPFVPLVVKRANGDLPAAAGLMLLASFGTIIVMPFGVRLVAPALTANLWSIARPLLLLVLLPLALGMLVKYRWASAAAWLYRYVKTITSIGTVIFLVLVVILNFKSFIGAVGTHAFLAQLIYVPALAVGGYLIGAGLPREMRSVISLGICTRNIGAAAAIVGSGGDQRIMVMLVIATLATVVFSFMVAACFARGACQARQIGALPKKVKV
jgi:predicted Na+-dependent transporter